MNTNEGSNLVSRPTKSNISPEELDLYGQHDPNGLAKRVAIALENSPEVNDINTLYIEQRDSVIILKGSISSPAILTKVSKIAEGIQGVSMVDSKQVAVD